MDTQAMHRAIEAIGQARFEMIDSVFHMRRRDHQSLQDRILDLMEQLDGIVDECFEIVDQTQRPKSKNKSIPDPGKRSSKQSKRTANR